MLARCKKTLALIMLVAGCLHAVNSLAVGLGELTVNSSLNEPLDATIQVLGLDGLTENQLTISLGNLQDFQRANLARVGLIDDIELEVEVFNREEGILRLTSNDPVIEPFLNMVISMRWPNGRLMRDYTALIDLPVFVSDEQATPVPVNAPVTPAPQPQPTDTPRSQILVDNEQPASTPRPVTTPAPQPDQSTETEPDQITETEPDQITESEPDQITETEPAAPAETANTPSPSAVAVDDEDVVVEAGDNLFNIAAANRPSNNVSVEQTMLAIQRTNPDAFIGDNINRIRVGSVLRIPSLQEIQSIDQSQAVNQVALQNQATSAQPLAFNSNTGSGNQQGEDELTILSGDEGTSPSGDSDLATTIAALESQLAVSEESLDRARLENQELQTRFAQLEEQIEILQNIIVMQDERLAQLQADLAANTAAPAPATETPAQPQSITAQPAPQENSLLGQVSSMFENTLVLISSLVALIVLVLGFLIWRRRAEEDEMEDFAMSGAAVAGGSRAVYLDDEHDGASAGFLGAQKSRLSREDDDENEDSDDAEVESYEDEEERGMLARLKGIFSRSSDDDDDFDVSDVDDSDEEEGYSDDAEEDADDSESDEIDDEISAFAMDEEDETDSEDENAEAEEEYDFDFDEDSEEAFDTDSDEDDDEDDDTVVLMADSDLDLGNIGDIDLDEEVDGAKDDADVAILDMDLDEDLEEDAEDSEEDVPEAFDFSLDDDESDDIEDVDKPAVAEAEAEDVESFDFSLDDTATPAVEETADSEDDDVESFDFTAIEKPVIEEKVAVEAEETEEDEVETFAFDVGSVSSFEEDSNDAGDKTAEENSEDDVETFDFDLGSNTDDIADTAENAEDDNEDPLAAALNEIDTEGETTTPHDDDDSDEFDLGDIAIDESLFDDDGEDETETGQRDEASTKLDLAVAYEAMGDSDGAREILNEVIAEGNDDQISEAKNLLEKWDLS